MDDHTLGDLDLHLLQEGRHYRSYEKLGAQVVQRDGATGVQFVVWAPHAREVSVIGDFNSWDPRATPLNPLASHGLWVGFVPHLGSGARYKYSILPAVGEQRIDKADPVAFYSEVPPQEASRVWHLEGYTWHDDDWMATRPGRHRPEAPIAIYEVHLESWMRVPEEGNRRLTYREIAPRLADHAAAMGFTHVQLLPLAEFPADASLGEQPTGLFAPSARYGTPFDLMALVDTLHQREIGVILDWSVAPLSPEAHGLVAFDGERLYEAPTPRPKGTELATPAGPFRPDLRNPKVVNHLVSSTLYWLARYHIDGVRVVGLDGLLFPPAAEPTASLVEADQEPRREEPDAVNFLRLLNDRVHAEQPGALTIAGETRFHWDVTRPMIEGGLGFDLKWDSAWVADFFSHYMLLVPEARSGAHDKLAAAVQGASRERRVLPLSRLETGVRESSLLVQLPGDDWRKFSSLRVLLGLLYALPGKKDLFMGTELGSWFAWNPAGSLDWHLGDQPRNAGLGRWVRDLNTTYRALPPLHAGDAHPEGFAWVDLNDRVNSVVTFRRRWEGVDVLVLCNFTPTARQNYRVGIERGGRWEEILNSDAPLYGGSGQGNMGGVEAAPVPWHGQTLSLNLTVPPLGMIALRRAVG